MAEPVAPAAAPEAPKPQDFFRLGAEDAGGMKPTQPITLKPRTSEVAAKGIDAVTGLAEEAGKQLPFGKPQAYVGMGLDWLSGSNATGQAVEAGLTKQYTDDARKQGDAAAKAMEEYTRGAVEGKLRGKGISGLLDVYNADPNLPVNTISEDYLKGALSKIPVNVGDQQIPMYQVMTDPAYAEQAKLLEGSLPQFFTDGKVDFSKASSHYNEKVRKELPEIKTKTYTEAAKAAAPWVIGGIGALGLLALAFGDDEDEESSAQNSAKRNTWWKSYDNWYNENYGG